MRRIELRYGAWVIAAIVAALTWAAPESRAGGVDFKAGKLRLELTGVTGFHSGSQKRENDQYGTLSVEYESKYCKRFTLGFRVYPAFVYGQQDSSAIYGAGLGIVTRVYQKKSLSGFYGEVGSGILFHLDKFRGNTSGVNFLSEAGLGYQFDKHWHIALKVHHISNLGIARHNDGVNALGLAIGYRF